jgi:hypothetical protein
MDIAKAIETFYENWSGSALTAFAAGGILIVAPSS